MLLDAKYNKSKKCVGDDEMLRVAGQLKLNLIVQNSYFNDENFSEKPIKNFNKPYYMTT